MQRETARRVFGRRPQLPLLRDADQTKLSAGATPAGPHIINPSASTADGLPHIYLVGPVHRCFLHPSCRLPTVIGVIAGKASVTDSSPAHPVAKAEHNVTTRIGPKKERFDRMSWTDWRSDLLKRKIEIDLSLLSYPGLDWPSHKAVTMIPPATRLSDKGQSAARIEGVMLRLRSPYSRLVPLVNDSILVLQAVCYLQI